VLQAELEIEPSAMNTLQGTPIQAVANVILFGT
jgi:hypothetical protein